MRTTSHLIVIVGGALVIGACSGEDSDSLVGRWTFSGQVPAIVTVDLNFKADQTFTYVEQVAPPTLPAGSVPNGCVTSQNFSAAYDENVAGGVRWLTWTFTDGTANVVSGCNDSSHDSAGTPMTMEAIAAYIEQGIIFPTDLMYVVTPTTLVVSSNVSGGGGIGRSAGTTFRKAP